MGVNVFSAHQIKDAIERDFNSVLTGEEMKRFNEGLSYKSTRTKETDQTLVNMLLNRLNMYKNGWIMSNALKTKELYAKAAMIDQIFIEMNSFSSTLNNLIIRFKKADMISEDKLEALREIERQLKKMNNE